MPFTPTQRLAPLALVCAGIAAFGCSPERREEIVEASLGEVRLDINTPVAAWELTLRTHGTAGNLLYFSGLIEVEVANWRLVGDGFTPEPMEISMVLNDGTGNMIATLPLDNVPSGRARTTELFVFDAGPDDPSSRCAPIPDCEGSLVMALVWPSRALLPGETLAMSLTPRGIVSWETDPGWSSSPFESASVELELAVDGLDSVPEQIPDEEP